MKQQKAKVIHVYAFQVAHITSKETDKKKPLKHQHQQFGMSNMDMNRRIHASE